MSRDIKFRAWQDGQMLTQPLPGIYAMKRFFGFLYEDTELMQFTGLNDKHGKEIFEGDIIRHIDITEYPDSREEKEIIEVVESLDVYIQTLKWIPHHGEIIGTVHENPELLK